jgi:outer membrane protein TolC
VEDNLASLQGVHNQQESLEIAEPTAAKAALTALAYYQESEVDLQVVLDTRHTWHESREQFIQSQLAWATGHVALFKALGGGWGY